MLINIKKVLKIISTTLLILLVLNAVGYLFVPEKYHYNFTGILEAKYGDAYSTINILGDSVDIELNFSTTLIYNTLYYEGYVIINKEKYLLNGKLFEPHSLIGKLYSFINHIGTIEPYSNDYLLTIPNFKNYSETYLYYLQCGKIVRLLIKKNDINYGCYEMDNT